MAESDTKWHPTAKQTLFIAALLSSGNASAAGESVGVPERTFRRWLADKDFRAALDSAESELIENAARRVLSLQSAAVAELANILTGRFPPALKLRAATAIIDVSVKLVELRRLEARLANLEKGPLDVRFTWTDTVFDHDAAVSGITKRAAAFDYDAAMADLAAGSRAARGNGDA